MTRIRSFLERTQPGCCGEAATLIQRVAVAEVKGVVDSADK